MVDRGAKVGGEGMTRYLWLLPWALAACSSTEPDADRETPPMEVGVPRGGCAPGFVHDDASSTCEPTLPVEPCPAGQLAVPGEGGCHPVAECGTDPYGELPAASEVVFVDGAYTGGANDGTRGHPFTTVVRALNAAKDGSVVAIAAGTYVEDLSIPPGVRVFGRCPSMVEVRGVPSLPDSWPIILKDRSELHRVAVTSATPAVAVFGASGALLEQVWVHDVGNAGVVVQATTSKASLTMRRSLIERAKKFGLVATAATVQVEASVVRGTALATGAKGGEGLVAQIDPDTRAPSVFGVRGSVIEGNASFGVLAIGSTVDLDGCVLLANRAEGEGGVGGGAFAQAAVETGDPSTVSIKRSLLSGNEVQGVGVKRSTLLVERSVIRDTGGRTSDGIGGPGVQVTIDASATVLDSVLERNHHAGALLIGGRLVLEGVIVRDTAAILANGMLGIGVGAQFEPTEAAATSLTVRRSLVSRNAFAGIVVNGAVLTLEDSRVEDTRASATTAEFGDGITLATVRLGEGIWPARATLANVSITGSARSGISVFAADLAMVGTAFRCNGIDLDVEPRVLIRSGTLPGSLGAIDEGSGNSCGCGDVVTTCKAQSAGLAPVPIPP